MELGLCVRKGLVVVLLCLMVLSQISVMTHTASADQILDVNVQTNKLSYDAGETVKITGNVTLDGTLKNDSLAAIEVDFPNGNPFLFRTVETGNVSGGYWKVQILDLYTCDSMGNPKTTFNLGSFAYVNLTVKNIDVVSHHAVATLYVQCSNNTRLHAFTVFESDIGGGQVMKYYPSFQIPSDAPTGEAKVFASLFSNLPSNSLEYGTPYCPEKRATFYIQTTTPSMPPLPQYFNVTFALAINDVMRGNYAIYATTSYGVQSSIEIRQFTVIGPVPIFTYSPANPIVCQTVTFDGSASYDPDGTIIDWSWQFGDGTTARGSRVTHVYEVAGYLPVTLTVTDNNGGSNSTTKYITVSEAWPMFLHNPSHWGNTTSPSPVKNSTLWSQRIGPDISTDPWMYSSPAVYPDSTSNVVFVGSSNGTVYAFNANSGAVIWKIVPSVGFKFYSSPAVAYGLVLIGSEDGRIYALNATNGAIKYSITTGGPVNSSVAIFGDRAFVGSRDKRVYAFYVNGTSLWTSELLDDVIDSSPAVANGKVFVATWNGSLYALHEANGTINWRTNLAPAKEICSSPMVTYDKVFVGSTDNKVYALSATNGAVLWNFTTGNKIYSSPSIHRGVVFIGSMDNNLYALDMSTGALVWNKTIGSIKWSSPSVAEGKVFVGTTGGRVYALREKNGDIWWSYQTGGAVDSSPSVLNETLYVCSKDGKIYAFYGQSHDIVVTSVVPSKTLVRKTETVIINAALWVKGSFNEALNVTASYGFTRFYETSISLVRGEERLIQIPWDTTLVPAGTYVITINATLIPPVIDEDLSNNIRTCQVKVELADVAIEDLKPSTPGIEPGNPIPVRQVVGKDYGVTIYAVIRNKSNFTESNLQVTFYWSNITHINQTIGTAMISALQVGASAMANITWSANNVNYGNYTLSASVLPVSGELNTADNFYNDGVVKVVIPGDVTSLVPDVPDGTVNMRDVGAVCSKFGTKPSSADWDPDYDINNDGTVNMRDIGIACQNFAKAE